MEKPNRPSPYDLSVSPKERKAEAPPSPKNPDYSPYSLNPGSSLKTLRESSGKKR